MLQVADIEVSKGHHAESGSPGFNVFYLLFCLGIRFVSRTGQWNLDWGSAAWQITVLLRHIGRMPEFQLT